MQHSATSSHSGVGRRSILTPYGYQSGSCGYCKDPASSSSGVAYYAKTSRLTPQHYQLLADRGWRRSGTLLYKPDQKRSCCPHYTIRLPVAQLQTSRNQRQALHRWNTFVLGQDYIKETAKRHAKSKESKAHDRSEFDLLKTVHESEVQNLLPYATPAHKFSVTLESDDFTEEKYKLFEQYQRIVHKEPPDAITRRGFKSFLCHSPLEKTSHSVNGKEQRLGSYHQCYRLDGTLIAMGVLDLMPHSVSSVYFIYHHDYEKWAFGRISALREAALVLEGDYQYYYMGYYIHSCPKMRYKVDFKPQYVLDPETNHYDPLDDEFRRRLDAHKYVSLHAASRASQAQTPEQNHTNDDTYMYDHDDDTTYPISATSSPASAAAAGLSLFDLRLTGITPLRELESSTNLGQIPVSLPSATSTSTSSAGVERLVPVENLVAWHQGSYNDPKCLRGTVADLVAAVGPGVAAEMVVDLLG